MGVSQSTLSETFRRRWAIATLLPAVDHVRHIKKPINVTPAQAGIQTNYQK